MAGFDEYKPKYLPVEEEEEPEPTKFKVIARPNAAGKSERPAAMPAAPLRVL